MSIRAAVRSSKRTSRFVAGEKKYFDGRRGVFAVSFSAGTMGKIAASLLVITLFAGCGVSSHNAERLAKATQDVASHLRAGDIDAIYNASEPFRHTTTLDNWRAWSNSVRAHWGVLQEVKIVRMERLAPNQGVYIVDTEMHYERGTTTGKFTFGIGSKEPVLLGAILADPTQQLPRTSLASSPKR